MWRILRAFTWMRWRVLMNSLERTGARDTIERFSLAVEQIAPFIAFGLIVPSALALAGVAAYAGYWLPSGGRVVTFDAIRIILVVACGLSLAGPLLMPSMERTSGVRLLLLPIPRRTLYVAQAGSALSDPWIVLAIPAVFSLPLGLAAAGAFTAALLAFAAGLLLLLLLVGLTALSTLVLHLIVRDRRRGELVTLLLVLLPVLFMIPNMMNAWQTREDRLAARAAAAERRERGEQSAGEAAWQASQRVYELLPSELFARTARSSARQNAGDAALPLLVLAVSSLVVHALGLVTFGRLLDSPAAASRRQASGAGDQRRVRIPGLSRGSAAVAQSQLRLALRTPRGRSSLASPVLLFIVFAVMASRRSMRFEMGDVNLAGGLGLAAFGSAVSLLSILPFAMNQFAIDRAGLTLALLAPISDRDFLIGKAVGNALVVGGPAILCVLIAYALFRDGSPALWVSLVPAWIATYALAAPGAAALSAIFPRHVDLNSIGRGSNAHGAAGFLGLMLVILAGVPSLLVGVIAILLLDRPALTPILMTAWCLVALALSRAMFGVVTVVFDKRRENVAMVAS